MLNYTLVSAASAATFTTSEWVDLGDLKAFGMEILVSGSNVVGTFTLQCSVSKDTFATVANSSQAITASADVVYDVTVSGYRYVRLAFTYTSGTGNITAKVVVKENLVKGA